MGELEWTFVRENWENGNDCLFASVCLFNLFDEMVRQQVNVIDISKAEENDKLKKISKELEENKGEKTDNYIYINFSFFNLIF